jgi:hypothetical protein
MVRSNAGGICIVVRWNAKTQRFSCQQVDPRKLAGARMLDCVHCVGGAGAASATGARKKAVLKAHKSALRPVKKKGTKRLVYPRRCRLHVRNWRKRASLQRGKAGRAR